MAVKKQEKAIEEPKLDDGKAKRGRKPGVSYPKKMKTVEDFDNKIRDKKELIEKIGSEIKELERQREDFRLQNELKGLAVKKVISYKIEDEIYYGIVNMIGEEKIEIIPCNESGEPNGKEEKKIFKKAIEKLIG